MSGFLFDINDLKLDHMAAEDWLPQQRYFDLALFSTPYPGLAGWKEVKTWREYLDWWDNIAYLLYKLSLPESVVASVIMWNRQDGFIPNEFFMIPEVMSRASEGRFKLVECYIWDKINPPPRGDLGRHDHPGYEFVWVWSGKPCARRRPYRKPYKAKSISRVTQKGGRGSDVRGSLSGGHTRLNPDGALQPNLIRAAVGQSNRPRVIGGAFPYALARRIIMQYSDEHDLVIDPFTGSGTTAVEALRLGRSFAGCDRDEKAVEIARQHVIDMLAPPPLLERMK